MYRGFLFSNTQAIEHFFAILVFCGTNFISLGLALKFRYMFRLAMSKTMGWAGTCQLLCTLVHVHQPEVWPCVIVIVMKIVMTTGPTFIINDKQAPGPTATSNMNSIIGGYTNYTIDK